MEWVQGAMVVAAPCSTRGSNNSEGSVGTAALRDIAVPDSPPTAGDIRM